MWTKVLSIFNHTATKVTIVAGLITALATIYNLYDERDAAKAELIKQSGKSEIVEQVLKNEIELRDKQIAQLQLFLEDANKIKKELEIKNKITQRQISSLKSSVGSVESEEELNRVTKEIMKCFVNC